MLGVGSGANPLLSPQDDWKKASNEAFFEVFCSGRRHAFNSTRDRCTVKLASSNHRRWAVHVIVHREYGPVSCPVG